MSEEKFTLEEAQKKFAIKANGHTWNLLGNEDRTPEDDRMLLLAAQASLYHWLQVGTVVNDFRGLYMIAKAYIALGKKKNALKFAKKTLKLTEANTDKAADFDIAFAYELMARAYAMNGKQEKFEKFHQKAADAIEKVADEQDKKICVDDFAAGPWFGMK